MILNYLENLEKWFGSSQKKKKKKKNYEPKRQKEA